MKKTVVWDFDHSLIPLNSDLIIPRALAPGPALEALFQTRDGTPWTQLIDRILGHMHSVGISASQIGAAARAMPFDDDIHRGIAELGAAGVEQKILSDANSLYIREFLEFHQLSAYFSDIHTNPATVAGDGGLVRLAPAVPPDAPHGCPLCPPNLCKGAVLRGWRTAAAAGQRFFYVGDGGGDVCACLQLNADDVVFARAGWPLDKELQGRHAGARRAALRQWCCGGELRAGLLAEVARS
jgi:pyridoxal phosphate phosphatase PHOSPHO2